MTNSKNFRQLSKGIWEVSSKSGDAAIVQFDLDRYKKHYKMGDRFSTSTKSGQQIQIMKWGSLNDLPIKRQELVIGNNIVPQIMRTTRNLLLGNGLMYYKEVHTEGVKRVIELPMPVAASDFFEMNNFETEFLPALVRDLIFNATMIPEFVRGKYNNKILSVEAKECAHSRSGIQDSKGKVKTWYWNGGWGDQARMQEFDTIALPIWDRKTDKQKRFVWVTGDSMFHDDYYNIPVWDGSANWIELANLIPEWHIKNLNNGYSPRWHIEVPLDYFVDKKKYQDIDALDEDEYELFLNETQTLRADFVKKISEKLAGVNGAGSTIFTDTEWSEALQKEMPGIKINALDSKLQHEAFTKLFDSTNIANVSAFGLPPVIASIQTAGRISAGAEIRNSLWLHIIVNTPFYRLLIAKIINFIHKNNEWDKAESGGKWGFRDIEITKLDENKVGHQPVAVQ